MSHWSRLSPPQLLDAITTVAAELLPVFLHGEDEQGKYLDVRLNPPENDPIFPGKVVSIRYYIKASNLPGILYKENPELDSAIRGKLADIIAHLQEWDEPDSYNEATPQSCSFGISNKGNLMVHFVTTKGKKRQRTLPTMEIPKWMHRRQREQ